MKIISMHENENFIHENENLAVRPWKAITTNGYTGHFQEGGANVVTPCLIPVLKVSCMKKLLLENFMYENEISMHENNFHA